MALFQWVFAVVAMQSASLCTAADTLKADIAVLDDASRSVVDRVHAARRLVRQPIQNEVLEALARNIALRELPTLLDSFEDGNSRLPIQALISTVPEGVELWAQQALDSGDGEAVLWAHAIQSSYFDPRPALQRLADNPARQERFAWILKWVPPITGNPLQKEQIDQRRDEIAAHTIENEKAYREGRQLSPDAVLAFPIKGNVGSVIPSPDTVKARANGSPPAPASSPGPPALPAATSPPATLPQKSRAAPPHSTDSFWQQPWTWIAGAALLGGAVLLVAIIFQRKSPRRH